MTSSPDVAPSSDVASSPFPIVALVVLGSNPDHVSRALEASRSEGAHGSFVVGGGAATRRAAEQHGATWLSNLPGLSEQLSDTYSHVWFLHADCRPRRGALAALTSEAERVDASVAGSKVLRADDPTLLESVGGATDVFGHPYSGLSEDEVDQEQYDVVRDVAFIPVVSVLIRRDLFRGLGGPDLLLAPMAQGIDLAQRARLLGGRVVVVPSSEVLHEGACAAGQAPWRERAGELRAIAKAYGPLTAIWAIPFAIAIGLIAGLGRLLIGKPGALFGEIKAWLWNIKNLPSTLAGRRSAMQARRVGDEELFRYQASGSVLLRQTGEEVTDWLRKRSHPDGALGALIERRRGFWQEPGFIGFIVAVLVGVVATRSLLVDGTPVTGFSLEPDPDWRAVLANYGGGWNPSGLGSPEPMRPTVALVTGASALGLSPAFLTLGSMLLAYGGTLRLLSTWGLLDRGRLVGALAAAFGPPLMALADTGYWPGFLAASMTPWAVDAAFRPLAGSLRFRIGRIGAGMLATGVMAALVPWLAVLPMTVAAIHAIVSPDRRWSAVLRAAAYGATSLLWVLPWLSWVVPDRLLFVGPAMWWDLAPWWGLTFLGLTGVGLALAPRRRGGVIATGALVAMAGVVISGAEVVGAGLEASTAGMVATVLGGAIVAGGVGATGTDGEPMWLPRLMAWSVVGALVVILAVPSVLPLLAGRAGFDGDLGEALAFAGPRAGPQGPDRILFLGEGAPGETRRLQGVPYRVMSAEVPLTEAWLPRRAAGDRALEQLLIELTDPQMQRPGAALAEFGIRWVVVFQPNPLEAGFQAKLDMRRLALFDVPFVVYENLESSPRAVREDGVIWRHDGFGYTGVARSEVSVRLAEQFDERWEPGAESDDWAIVVEADTGVAGVDPDGRLRRLAIVSAAVAAGSLIAAAAGIGARRQ